MDWKHVVLLVTVILMVRSAFAIPCTAYDLKIAKTVEYYNIQGRMIASGFVVKNEGNASVPFDDIKIEIMDDQGKVLSQTNGQIWNVDETALVYALKRVSDPRLFYVGTSVYAHDNGDAILQPGEQMVFVYAYQEQRSPGTKIRMRIDWGAATTDCERDDNAVYPIAYEQTITVEAVGAMKRIVIDPNGGKGVVSIAPVADLREVYLITNEQHRPAAIGLKMGINQSMGVPIENIPVTVNIDGKEIQLEWSSEELLNLIDVIRKGTNENTLYPIKSKSSAKVGDEWITQGVAALAARMPDLENAKQVNVTLGTSIGTESDGIFEYGIEKQTISFTPPKDPVGYGTYEVWPEEKLLDQTASDIVKVTDVHAFTDASGNVRGLAIFIRNEGTDALDPRDITVKIDAMNGRFYQRFDGDHIELLPYDRFGEEGQVGKIYYLTSIATNGTQIKPGYVGAIGIVPNGPIPKGDEVSVDIEFPYTAMSGLIADLPENLQPGKIYAIYPEVREIGDYKMSTKYDMHAFVVRDPSETGQSKGDGKHVLILMATTGYCRTLKWVKIGDENFNKNTCTGVQGSFEAAKDIYTIENDSGCTLFDVTSSPVEIGPSEICTYMVTVNLKNPWKYGEKREVVVHLDDGTTIEMEGKYPYDEEIPIGNIVAVGRASTDADNYTEGAEIRLERAKWDGDLYIRVAGNMPFIAATLTVRNGNRNDHLYAIYPNKLPPVGNNGEVGLTIDVPSEYNDAKPVTTGIWGYFNIGDITKEITVEKEVNEYVPPTNKPTLRINVSVSRANGSTSEIREGDKIKICVLANVKNGVIEDARYTVKNIKTGVVLRSRTLDMRHGGYVCRVEDPLPSGEYIVIARAEVKGYEIEKEDSKTFSVTRVDRKDNERVAEIIRRIANKFDMVADRLDEIADKFEEYRMGDRAYCLREAASIARSEATYLNGEAERMERYGVSKDDLWNIIQDIREAIQKIRSKIHNC